MILFSVYRKGLIVFDHKADLRHWLTSRVASLGYAKPIDLLIHESGRERVMAVLNALEHGIYL